MRPKKRSQEVYSTNIGTALIEKRFNFNCETFNITKLTWAEVKKVFNDYAGTITESFLIKGNVINQFVMSRG